MKKEVFLYLMILMMTLGCRNSNSDSESIQHNGLSELSDTTTSKRICLRVSPAFHEGFVVELDEKDKSLYVIEDYYYYFADSISENSFTPVTDSMTFALLDKVLPKKSPRRIDLTAVEFEKLSKLLTFLTKYQLTERDMIPPLDGIAVDVYNKNGDKISNEKCFYSPSENTKQGEIIIQTFDLLSQIFSNDISLEEKVENAQRYIHYKNNRIIKIKDKNPLYIKLLDMPFGDCDLLKEEIKKMPESDVLFLDVTNFEGEKQDCLFDLFREKYSDIKLISREMFFLDKE